MSITGKKPSQFSTATVEALRAKLALTGQVAGSFSTALPTGTIATDRIYLFTGTNAASIGGIIWYNGDSALYNGSTWTRIPFQALTNYYLKSNFAIQWKHSRGDAEYVGNNYNEYFGVGVGIMSGNGGPTFNQIKVPFYCLPDGVSQTYKVRVAYKTFGDWLRTTDSLTTVEDFTIPGSDFNKDPDGFQVITLSSDFALNTNHSLIILATPVSGIVKMGVRNWSTAASATPTRVAQYSFNDLTGFDDGKQFGQLS